MFYMVAFAIGFGGYPAARWAWQKYAAPKVSALMSAVTSKFPS